MLTGCVHMGVYQVLLTDAQGRPKKRGAAAAGNLMVVALADVEGLQKVAYFTLKNLYQPGDTIHTTFVEDTAGKGGQTSIRKTLG